MTYAGLLAQLDSEQKRIAETMLGKNGNKTAALVSSLNQLDLIRARSAANQRESWHDDHEETLLNRYAQLYAENAKFCGQNVAFERENQQLKNQIMLAQQRIRNFSRIHGIGFTGDNLADYVTNLLAAFRRLLMTDHSIANLPEHAKKQDASMVKQKNEQAVDMARLKSEFERQRAAADESKQALLSVKDELLSANNQLGKLKSEIYALNARILQQKQVIYQLESRQLYDQRRADQEQCEQTSKGQERERVMRVTFYDCQKGVYTAFFDCGSYYLENRTRQAYTQQLEAELQKWYNEARSVCKARDDLQARLAASQGVIQAHNRQIYQQKREIYRLKEQLASATNEFELAQRQITSLQQQIYNSKALDLTACSKDDLSEQVVQLYAKIAPDEQPDANYEAQLNTCITYIYYLQNFVKELKQKQVEERQQLEFYRCIVEVPKNDAESQCERTRYEIASFDVFAVNVQGQLNRLYNQLVWPYNVRMLYLRRKLSDVIADDAQCARMHQSFCQVTVIALYRIQGYARVLKNCVARFKKDVYSTAFDAVLRQFESRMLAFGHLKTNASTYTVPTRELSHHIVLYYLDDHETAEEMRGYIDGIFEALCPKRSKAVPTKEAVAAVLDAAARYTLLLEEMSAHVQSLQAENENLQLDRQLFDRTVRIADSAKQMLNCSYDQVITELGRAVYSATECRRNASALYTQADQRLIVIEQAVANCAPSFEQVKRELAALRGEILANPGATLLEQLANSFARYRGENRAHAAELAEQISQAQALASRQLEAAAQEKAGYDAVMAKWTKALQHKWRFAAAQTPEQLYELTTKLASKRGQIVHEMPTEASLDPGVCTAMQTDHFAAADKAVQVAEDQDVRALLSGQREIATRQQEVQAAMAECSGQLNRAQTEVTVISRQLVEAYELAARGFQARLEQENQQFRQLQMLAAAVGEVAPAEDLSVQQACDLLGSKISLLYGEKARMAALNRTYMSKIQDLSAQLQELAASRAQSAELARQLDEALETIDGLQEELYTQQSKQSNTTLLSSVRERFYNDEFAAFSFDVKHRLAYLAGLSDAAEQVLQHNVLEGTLRRVYTQLSELRAADYGLFGWVSRVIVQAGELARDEGLEQQMREIYQGMRRKDSTISQYANIVAQTGKVLAEIVASNRQDVYQSVLMLNKDYQRILSAAAQTLQ